MYVCIKKLTLFILFLYMIYFKGRITQMNWILDFLILLLEMPFLNKSNTLYKLHTIKTQPWMQHFPNILLQSHSPHSFACIGVCASEFVQCHTSCGNRWSPRLDRLDTSQRELSERVVGNSRVRHRQNGWILRMRSVINLVLFLMLLNLIWIVQLNPLCSDTRKWKQYHWVTQP